MKRKSFPFVFCILFLLVSIFQITATNVGIKKYQQNGQININNLEDTIPPTIICPPDIFVSCYWDIPDPYSSFTEFQSNGGSAWDNIGIDESSFILLDVTVNGNCPRIIERTYQIADLSGNTGTCIHTITVDDPEPPTITCPADIMVECDVDVPAIFTTLNEFIAGGGTADDNCSIASFTCNESVSGTCPRIYIRTYTVIDSCLNETSCIHTITQDDTTDPTITCPADITVECAVDVSAMFTTLNEFIAGGGAADDNCGIAYFTNSESVVGICPRIYVRTYTVIDSCFNETSCVHVVTQDDTYDPMITCPPDTTIMCIEDVPPQLTTLAEFIAAGGEASDNCGIESFMSFETITGECPAIIEREYAVEDSCGNWTSYVQTITTNVYPHPTEFEVKGGGMVCQEGFGTTVFLLGSETNVEYELYLDDNTTGNLKLGTGGHVYFNNLNVEGNYTIFGRDTAHSCMSQMIGSADVYYITPYPFDEIVIVTVDTLSQKNKITWSKTPDVFTISHSLYKETSSGGVYELIKTTPFEGENTYLDFTSTPELFAERYAISVTDTCGTESELSSIHKPIHLDLVKVSNGYKLIWDEYIGCNYPTYFIHRANTPYNFSIIDSVSNNVLSYTDVNPPFGLLYYLIEISNTNTISSISNIVTSEVGIENYSNSSIRVYPNPSNGNLYITNIEKCSSILYSLQGEIILKTDANIIDIKDFQKGMYFLYIEDDEGRLMKVDKIIKY